MRLALCVTLLSCAFAACNMAHELLLRTNTATRADVDELESSIHTLVPLRTERDMMIVKTHILGKSPRELAVELAAFQMESGTLLPAYFDQCVDELLVSHGQTRDSLASFAVDVFHAGHAVYDHRDFLEHYSQMLSERSTEQLVTLSKGVNDLSIDGSRQ